MTDPTVAPYRQLRRPLDDRIVAGVCSGIGRYLSVDPVLIRVGFAGLAVLTWGTALLAYPVMWFLMPEEPGPAAPPWRDPADPTWGQAPGYPAAGNPAYPGTASDWAPASAGSARATPASAAEPASAAPASAAPASAAPASTRPTSTPPAV